VERKLAYPHCHQTRLRGLDEPQTELAIINKEEDSDTEASGSWAAPIPRYDNHKVGPRIDVWAEEETMASLLTERNCNVGCASSLSRQGSHGGIMDAFTDMLAVRGCGSSETIFPELWELCCWLGI
jgi:hypothetical protein